LQRGLLSVEVRSGFKVRFINPSKSVGNHMGVNRKTLRRGISETVSLVIGVAIAVAVGAILFNVIPSLISSQIQSVKALATASAYKVSREELVVYLQLKYMGTVAVNASVGNVLVYGKDLNLTGSIASVEPDKTVTLSPGDEMSFIIRIKNDSVASVAPGDKVLIEYVLSAGGKEVRFTTSATVQ